MFGPVEIRLGFLSCVTFRFCSFFVHDVRRLLDSCFCAVCCLSGLFFFVWVPKISFLFVALFLSQVAGLLLRAALQDEPVLQLRRVFMDLTVTFGPFEIGLFFRTMFYAQFFVDVVHHVLDPCFCFVCS